MPIIISYIHFKSNVYYLGAQWPSTLHVSDVFLIDLMKVVSPSLTVERGEGLRRAGVDGGGDACGLVVDHHDIRSILEITLPQGERVTQVLRRGMSAIIVVFGSWCVVEFPCTFTKQYSKSKLSCKS